MNENLIVPKQVQGILEEVENTPLYLAELPMEAHPKLPQFNRFIRVINLDAKSENEFVMFGYFRKHLDCLQAIEKFGDRIKKLYID